jgi:hypothetical protein
MSFSHDLASRVHRLAETLATLRLRVREAVAGETARAVGEAVRDLLAAALEGRLGSRTRRSREWDDDETHYVPSSPARWKDTDESDPSVQPRTRRAARWSAALAFAATAVRCWATRRLPVGVVLVIGTFAGIAAWTSGPLAHSGLALLAAAGNLFPPTDPMNGGTAFF